MPCSGPVQYLCVISETIFALQSVASLHGEEYRLDARGCSCPAARYAHCPYRFVKSASNELVIITGDTDVKLDNLLFGNSLFPSDDEMQQYLETNPAEVEGQTQLEGESYPIIKSQPIPNGYAWDTSAFEAEKMIIYLTDLGHGQYPSSIHSFVPRSWTLQRKGLVNSRLPTALAHLLSAHRRRSCNRTLVQQWISGL